MSVDKKKKTVIRKPRLKFIDKLHQVLEAAGMEIKRDGWDDYSFDKNGKRSETKNDTCEWLDIILKEEDGKRYIVQFYFENNSTKLNHVQVYKQKRKKGWGMEKLIASNMKDIPVKTEKVTPQ